MNLISEDDFRRKIAMLVKSKEFENEISEKTRNDIIEFISLCPKIFGDELDRLTMWERIGNGLKISVEKSGEIFENFINHFFVYIKADFGKISKNKDFESKLKDLFEKSENEKMEIMKNIIDHYYLLMIRAKERWNEIKSKKSGDDDE